MLASGTALIAGALLALVTLALVSRRPDPPRWAERSWFSELASVGIVAMFALGLGLLFTGVVTAWQEGPNLLDLGLFAAVLLGAVVLWRRLDVRGRLKAMAAEEDALRSAPATHARGAPGQAARPVVTPEPPPSRPTHRAA